MRAAAGAISSVRAAEGRLVAHVLGGGPARGICGSGLVDAVARGLELGRIEPSGRLAGGGSVLELQDGLALTQRDIRELQLAKGAIRTGIDMLLDVTGVSLEGLARIRLAGNFGSGLDIRKTIRLGLIPPLPVERVDVVGNAALRGAALALVSREYRERAARVHRSCRFLELAARPDFQMRFASSLFF